MDLADLPPIAEPALSQQTWLIKNLSIIFVCLSWSFAIVSLLLRMLAFIISSIICLGKILVSVWTLDSGPVGLNHPNWGTNLFAWHPVMMVAVFFFGQVFAITSWVLADKTNLLTILHHSVWQCAALSGLVAGLIAVFKHCNNENKPNMAGMHSWLGILSSIVYLLNFLIGLFTAIFRDLETFEFRVVHQLIGMYAFILTVSSIISGITLYQGEEKYVGPNGCIYDGWTFTRPDYNPATNYGLLPRGCQISSGLGLMIAITASFVLFAAGLHRLLSGQGDVRQKVTERQGATLGSNMDIAFDNKSEEKSEEVTIWKQEMGMVEVVATENVADIAAQERRLSVRDAVAKIDKHFV